MTSELTPIAITNVLLNQGKSRQNFTCLLCSEFACHVSLKGKALRFLQCVYFWGENKAQGGETYDIFGGQLEEGGAGIA